ncbi:hypothetical protein MLD38_023634 [Melastoma candidum]|uniref:Uncharacterized protein n=1 Tax=Melastoma candidum TaxID=119954 RepID=A0ACB9NUR1_9MYRT|nr:hypothetical protein MLD38_023634 [Melastoma candidum]
MAEKKIIAICQSGGEFVTSKDGSLSYHGGDAYAIDISEQTQLNDLRTEVAEMFNCSVDTMAMKYFLPGNRKTLITISKDKDLQRMLSFVGDSITVDVFVIPDEAAARNMSIMPASRSSRTTASEVGDLVTTPIHVVYDTNSAIDLIQSEPPLCTIPVTSNDENLRKAAVQWENTIIGVDQRFNSFKELKEALYKYSIAHGFSYKYKKNDNHRVCVKCKFPGCPWRIYASRLSTTQLICIKKMNPTHTCEGAIAKGGYRAKKSWVGSIIKEKLKDSPNYRPKDIAEDIRREYGIELNYSQAWRAKEVAREQIQGSYKEAYKLLPSLCERIVETNPGSIARFSTKEDSSFHRIFISFHASISGFQQGCRPLLFLDSCCLNSKYQGVLLAATSADGDDGVFPVAFAVVDVESEENWRWFLEELKSAVSTSQQITFIADFQNGLKKSVAEVFDNCYHSYCLRHLASNLIKELRGQFSHEARKFLINDLYAAANAVKLEGFQNAIDNIKNISVDAYNWLIQSEPEHWANAFFVGARYNHMSSDFGQELYSWVSEEPELPITQVIDVLRGKMMESIYSRRVASNEWATKLTPSKEEKLQVEASAAQTLQVLLSQGNAFEVRGADSSETVDIDHWDCSCKGWQLSGMPCSHAVAVFQWIDRSPYDYCSKYFTVEYYRLTYAESIRPVPNVEKPSPGQANGTPVVVTPPPKRRTPGRPRSKQVELDLTKRQLQCSLCKGLGHNKKTCKSTEVSCPEN